MDFTNQGTRPQAVTPSHPAGPTGKKSKDSGKWSRISQVVIVAVVAILLLAVVAFVGFDNQPKDNEDSYVNTSKLQAVFLNTGQVYFGKITELNNNYFVVKDIYYLQTSGSSSTTSTTSSNTSVSLVKLGCELHEPYDQMVINRSQVTFWENLQSDGQVAQAVATFQKDNPNGQKCSDQSASASTTSGTVQNASTTATTPTTTTSKQ